MFYLSEVLGNGVFKVANTNGGISVYAPESGEATTSYAHKLLWWLNNMGFNRAFNNLEEKAVKSLVDYGIPVYGYSANGSHKCYSSELEVIERHTAIMRISGLSGATLSDGYQGLSLLKYSGSAEKLIVPKFITSISTNCCSRNAYLKEVEIRNKNFGIISGAAFYKCSNLRKVVLSEFVDTIDAHAFRECDNLTDFIGDYRRIESYGFSRNMSLREFNVSSKCVSIGRSAFERCRNLEVVIFGESLTSIDNGAFNGCRSLRRVVLPDSLEFLGSFVFDDCRSLEEVRLSNGVYEQRVRQCQNFRGDVIIERR